MDESALVPSHPVVRLPERRCLALEIVAGRARLIALLVEHPHHEHVSSRKVVWGHFDVAPQAVGVLPPVELSRVERGNLVPCPWESAGAFVGDRELDAHRSSHCSLDYIFFLGEGAGSPSGALRTEASHWP